MGKDWQAWHEAYARPDSSLSKRLAAVQRLISLALHEPKPGPVKVISLCAGEGRDLLGVLPTHPRREDVTARLVEMDPVLAGRARAAAEDAGLTKVEVVVGDAAAVGKYEGLVPADVVLVCGVFGNIDDADIHNTVSHLPQLCANGAVVIWTRHRRAPDFTPTIRGWFEEAGFEELTFESEGAGGFGVGAHVYRGMAAPYRPDTHLFTFAI